MDLNANPSAKAAARWVLESIAAATPANVYGFAKSWFTLYSSNPVITIYRFHLAENQNQCLNVDPATQDLVLGSCGQYIFGWSEEDGPLWSFFGPTKKPKMGRPSNGPPLVEMPQLQSVQPWTTRYSGAPSGNQKFTGIFAGNML